MKAKERNVVVNEALAILRELSKKEHAMMRASARDRWWRDAAMRQDRHDIIETAIYRVKKLKEKS